MLVDQSRWVLASDNPGKLRELAQLFAAVGIELLPQSEFGVKAIAETGLSFVENAILKARHAAQQTNLPALADDSGLEVDALDGAPGIYSARFAGEQANDAANNEYLLRQLKNVPDTQRTARYQCILVLMRHAQDPVPIIVQASWEGRIMREPHGKGGFGYDPLFWLPDLRCTAAELSPEHKNRLSHRGKAMSKLKQLLVHE